MVIYRCNFGRRTHTHQPELLARTDHFLIEGISERGCHGVPDKSGALPTHSLHGLQVPALIISVEKGLPRATLCFWQPDSMIVKCETRRGKQMACYLEYRSDAVDVNVVVATFKTKRHHSFCGLVAQRAPSCSTTNRRTRMMTS